MYSWFCVRTHIVKRDGQIRQQDESFISYLLIIKIAPTAETAGYG